jgi:hypothetical protein
VRLVDHEQRAGVPRHPAQRVVIAGLGQDDPHVGHRGLGEHARDLSVGEGAVERVDVVELDRPGRLGWVDRRPHVAVPRAGAIGRRHGERLVDAPVVAVAEHQDLGAVCDLAGDPQRRAVGVGGGQGERPAIEAETAPQLLADPGSVLGREHRCDSPVHLIGDGIAHHARPVAGHRARVAEAEIHVGVPVDVRDPGAFRPLGEDGKAPRPEHHPRHRHAAEERVECALIQLARPRVPLDEIGELTRQ